MVSCGVSTLSYLGLREESISGDWSRESRLYMNINQVFVLRIFFLCVQRGKIRKNWSKRKETKISRGCNEVYEQKWNKPVQKFMDHWVWSGLWIEIERRDHHAECHLPRFAHFGSPPGGRSGWFGAHGFAHRINLGLSSREAVHETFLSREWPDLDFLSLQILPD